MIEKKLIEVNSGEGEVWWRKGGVAKRWGSDLLAAYPYTTIQPMHIAAAGTLSLQKLITRLNALIS